MNKDQGNILALLSDGRRQPKEEIRFWADVDDRALAMELTDLVVRGALICEQSVLDDYYTITPIGSSMLELK